MTDPDYLRARADMACHLADLARVAESAERIPGYRIVESPAVLRHFGAKLEPVPICRAGSWTGI